MATEITTGGGPGRAPRAVRAPARASVTVSVLGPLQVWRDGRAVPVGHARQQAVLAALALGAGRAGGRVVGRQELLDGVWGVEAPAANVVPVYVYRLRKALRGGPCPADPVIVHEGGGYRLAAGAVDVDAVRLEGLVAEVGAAERAGDLPAAVRGCARALGLFRGEPLAGLPGPLAEMERLRLTERRIGLVVRKAEHRLRLGQCAQAVDELFAVFAAHPLNEPAAALLMRALARSDRRADAVTVYDRTRRRLAEDLGVPPSRMLRRTHQSVLRAD